MDKIVIASSTTSQRTSAENICQDGRTKLPSRGFPNATPIRVRARTEVFSGERFFRGGIETRGARAAHNSCPRAEAEISRYVDCYIGRLTPMCAWQPLPFHLRRRKFSTIWPDIRRHKTPSTVSFTGGCSTPAFESGPRELQRPSRNSSNKVFSKKSDLRTAKYFTAPPRTISRRFSNGHHETLLLTQPRKPSNKKGQSCLPR